MNNIKFLRKKKGLTQAQLCKVLNIAQPTLSGYETGNYEPDQDTLGRIADYFGVTVDFILGRENHTTIDTTPRAAKIKDLAIKDEVELNDFYPVPLLGSVVAGVPIESQEDLEGYVYISFKPKEEYFALRVHGESMINAGIRDNSILIVHKQPYANCGDIVVAMLNGEQTVKRFKMYGDNIFLMPENPAFEPIPVLKGADFLILGKVVEVRMAL
jgi:repressor LexA